MRRRRIGTSVIGTGTGMVLLVTALAVPQPALAGPKVGQMVTGPKVGQAVAGPKVGQLVAGPKVGQVVGGVQRVGRQDGPPAVDPDDIRFQRRALRTGRPQEVGLLPEYVDRLRADAEAYLTPTPDHPNFPTYAGAVLLAAKDGVVVRHDALGMAVKYESVGPAPGRVGVELPADQQIPMRRDTIFDLASISKLFTTVVALRQVERGTIDLDAPVVRYLPEFAAGGKEAVTVRMLLTHTGGLPAFAPLWSAYPTPEAREAAALATPFAAGATPGNQYVYSDLGLIALGVLVERVTGRPLEHLVAAEVTGPLRMHDTGYNPAPALRHRIAATEYQPYANRGIVWGEVHDENAWALGGVAGHAGLFSTAADLAIFCQMLLNGGEYRGARILRESTVRDMLVNYNAGLETRYPDSDRGLGFELNKHGYMGPLASPVTFGHTGFTGTSIVVDPLSQTFLILLTNRVHPDRNWGTNTVARRALARDLAYAIPVRPPLGGTAWRADDRDGGSVTLTAPLRRAAGRAAVASFRLWYDTEPRYDVLHFQTSADGGETWTPVDVTLLGLTGRWTAEGSVTGYGGRRWWQALAELPVGTTHLRWSYATDATSRGRGVYVDALLAVGTNGLLFSGEGTDATRFTATGWTPSDR
ncbi:serine hydrolase [Plantactinospora endophytica]|uniref:Serine hydrolase n=1 Tax=Plantactinospora endophytica TaxID=673535 RepID=A0ABQ4DTJ8_9ACTN|nr:serine hydrolase [Plantactinospora endophytica]GIG85781.1 serine hydrolase [Plantactinospora endophytica]